MHVSIKAPELSKIDDRVAIRGEKKPIGFFDNKESDLREIGPLKRRTERPPTPGGVAEAIIVSFATTKTKLRSLLQRKGET